MEGTSWLATKIGGRKLPEADRFLWPPMAIRTGRAWEYLPLLYPEAWAAEDGGDPEKCEITAASAIASPETAGIPGRPRAGIPARQHSNLQAGFGFACFGEL